MKIDIKRILPNPHRDLNLNPLRNDQVAKLVESIQRTGFWDNLVVRKHPNKSGYYELAYGHNRMAAVTKAGITEVDLPVRDLSDWDMYLCMVDENNTQTTITPSIVFENIGTGAKLLEKYITESETCEEFQAKIASLANGNYLPKRSSVWQPNAGSKTRSEDYTKLRAAVLAGEGVGKDFVQRYVPGAAKDVAVVSTVLASIYGERRAAAAKVKAEAAAKEKARLDAELAERREQERAAEAKRKADEAAAKEAQRKANEAVREQQAKAAIAKAQREAEVAEKRAEQSRRDRVAAEAEATKAKMRADLAQRELLATQAKAQEIAKQSSIPKDILLSLGSPAVMADFAMIVKRLGIPASKITQAAEEVMREGWSQKTMRVQLPIWWDEVSGEQGRRYARAANERKREADIKKYCNGDLNGFIMKQNDKLRAAMRDMDTVQEYVEFASPTLQKNSAVLYAAVAKQLFTIIAKIDGQSVEKTVSTLTKMLSHR